ncbi:hypothetical protein EDC01DRAFT_616066 [Geopyxis carbonaria]|nr:hypothetical protein EDC01DRAFT_616066 [Geopyxis carbonaria]
MSSIFTFNHSPPKPASPWLGTPSHPSPAATPQPPADDPDIILDDVPGHLRTSINSGRVRGSFINSTQPLSGQIKTDDGEVVKGGLEAEPQIGSTEYKLSLSRGGKNDARLEQLTTQLLWRLQQSTPYHATSLATKSPEAIASMLQESSGALYEIGVADDGTLVGLDEAELNDSIDVLKQMAAKLGASVTILRRVYVRTVDETKVDPLDAEKFSVPKLHTKLFVVEALVKPFDGSNPLNSPLDLAQSFTSTPTQELRVSLTGPTTCGKSTLLGTLSTGELDNGRGKSRLSLLKHRHELISGVTSSITQELFGYKPHLIPNEKADSEDGFFGDSKAQPEPEDAMSRLVNYATGNVSSWTDIHSASENGRVVFVSDSAGHLKYSRTTIRSLVGWEPHYAALLIAANDCTEDGKPGLSEASRTHIELCLKLGLRLIVIFTKIDLGSMVGLKVVFSAVLTTLKANGRKPLIVKSANQISNTVESIKQQPEVAVPIVFTSAVRGDNINLVHELLMNIPVPEPSTAPAGHGDHDDGDAQLTTVFHIEEVYGMKPTTNLNENDGGSVVSGHVRYGKVSIGDRLIVGPFPTVETTFKHSRSATPTPTATPIPISSLLSTSAAHHSNLLSRSPDSGDEGRSRSHRSAFRDLSEQEEWRLVKVISVRHLRLPVTTLFAGEAGTIGVVPVKDELLSLNEDVSIRITGSEPIDISNGAQDSTSDKKAVSFATPPAPPLDDLHLKRGLVFLNPRPSTYGYTGFTATLDKDDAAANALLSGSDVTVYIASVRAVARIISIEGGPRPAPEKVRESDGMFGFEDSDEEDEEHVDNNHPSLQKRKFRFEFSGVEWVERGAKVLVTKSGSARSLEVFVGRVVSRERRLVHGEEDG